MSKLTELWKSISTTLHLPELTKPLWEQTIKQVDSLEERVAKLEGGTIAALPDGLIAQLKADWEKYQTQKAQHEADAAARVLEQEAAMAAIAKAVEDKAAADAQAETKAAEGETIAANAETAPAGSEADAVKKQEGETAGTEGAPTEAGLSST